MLKLEDFLTISQKLISNKLNRMEKEPAKSFYFVNLEEVSLE